MNRFFYLVISLLVFTGGCSSGGNSGSGDIAVNTYQAGNIEVSAESLVAFGGTQRVSVKLVNSKNVTKPVMMSSSSTNPTALHYIGCYTGLTSANNTCDLNVLGGQIGNESADITLRFESYGSHTVHLQTTHDWAALNAPMVSDNNFSFEPSQIVFDENENYYVLGQYAYTESSNINYIAEYRGGNWGAFTPGGEGVMAGQILNLAIEHNNLCALIYDGINNISYVECTDGNTQWSKIGDNFNMSFASLAFVFENSILYLAEYSGRIDGTNSIISTYHCQLTNCLEWQPFGRSEDIFPETNSSNLLNQIDFIGHNLVASNYFTGGGWSMRMQKDDGTWMPYATNSYAQNESGQFEIATSESLVVMSVEAQNQVYYIDKVSGGNFVPLANGATLPNGVLPLVDYRRHTYSDKDGNLVRSETSFKLTHLVVSGNRVYLVGTDNQIYTATTIGNTWELVGNLPEYVKHQLTVLAVHQNKLFVATGNSNGVNHSTVAVLTNSQYMDK